MIKVATGNAAFPSRHTSKDAGSPFSHQKHAHTAAFAISRGDY